MEFPFKSATVSTFAHATEDEQKVIAAIQILLPGDTEIKRTKLKGHHGNPIISFETLIEQKKPLRELLQRMVEKLRAEDFGRLSGIISDRIDESCRLYLRFDKQRAHAGELTLTNRDDAIHLRLKVAVYPSKREVAAKLIGEFIAAQAQKNG